MLTVQDAIDRYESELDEYIQECVWGDGFSENRASDLLDECATRDGLTIDWQPGDGRIVWDVYRYSEKGLS